MYWGRSYDSYKIMQGMDKEMFFLFTKNTRTRGSTVKLSIRKVITDKRKVLFPACH